MKKFYKVNGDKVELGMGNNIPDGYIEYDVLPADVQSIKDVQDTSDQEQIKVHESFKYLTDTDWYYARKLETGEEIPSDTLTKRTEAREFLRSKGF